MEPKQEKFFKRFGVEVRKIRLNKGLTLEDMQSFGFSSQHFQKIESGKKAINLYTAFRISSAFNIKISTLLSKID